MGSSCFCTHYVVIEGLIDGERVLRKDTLFLQGVKKVSDPKQNYIGLMTEG